MLDNHFAWFCRQDRGEAVSSKLVLPWRKASVAVSCLYIPFIHHILPPCRAFYLISQVLFRFSYCRSWGETLLLLVSPICSKAISHRTLHSTLGYCVVSGCFAYLGGPLEFRWNGSTQTLFSIDKHPYAYPVNPEGDHQRSIANLVNLPLKFPKQFLVCNHQFWIIVIRLKSICSM